MPLTNKDRTFIKQHQCGQFEGKIYVCCRESSVGNSKSISTPPTIPLQQFQSKSELPKPGECGIDAELRIVGGNVTAVDEYPWMALLQYTKRMNDKIKAFTKLITHKFSSRSQRISLWWFFDQQQICYHCGTLH